MANHLPLRHHPLLYPSNSGLNKPNLTPLTRPRKLRNEAPTGGMGELHSIRVAIFVSRLGHGCQSHKKERYFGSFARVLQNRLSPAK